MLMLDPPDGIGYDEMLAKVDASHTRTRAHELIKIKPSVYQQSHLAWVPTMKSRQLSNRYVVCLSLLFVCGNLLISVIICAFPVKLVHMAACFYDDTFNMTGGVPSCFRGMRYYPVV